jgi:hypothetical protein
MTDRDGGVTVEQQQRRLADDFAAPDDDRVAPAMAIRPPSISMTPAGVHATSAALFCTRRPTLTGVTPSTSFAGSTIPNTCCMAEGWRIPQRRIAPARRPHRFRVQPPDGREH